ncbi:lysophospholipase, partial [Myxococcota bacterium]|nr:lysophospholipase [Myxococcota bacterium]MBU1536476.1 lysophospholipase [Myxococcota bacterium]
LGGGVTSWLAARTRPAGVILESTFTSVPDLAADLFWYLPSRYFAKQRYNTWKRIHRITSPLLVIHSKEDDLIPYAHGKKNFRRARCTKYFLTIKGKHNGGAVASGSTYTKGLGRFLKTLPR